MNFLVTFIQEFSTDIRDNAEKLDLFSERMTSLISFEFHKQSKLIILTLNALLIKNDLQQISAIKSYLQWDSIK